MVSYRSRVQLFIIALNILELKSVNNTDINKNAFIFRASKYSASISLSLMFINTFRAHSVGKYGI